MRLLPAAFALALAACGPTSTTTSTGDAASDATDVTAADQCSSRPMGDLAPLPPGCRVINPDPCTGRGTIVCPDAGDDAAADATVDAPSDAPADVRADAEMDVCMIECAAPPPGCRYEGPVTCVPRSCGTLVCPADAGADAPAADVAGDGAVACGASFPTFRQDCAGDSDCVVAIHQTDCCGNQRGLGLHGSQRAAFDAAEAVCRPMFPRCGCPTRGVLCDDDRWSIDPATIGVACRANRCTTFVR
ncbi:MAG: hypothetical protein U0324_01005 [Polyangiales bacterium]